MDIYIKNIEELTLNNKNYRKVLFTTPDKKMQLVVMSLKPNEEIGLEIHKNVNQFFRIEEGEGIIVYENKKKKFFGNAVIIIPANTYHNIINTGNYDMKLYTIYTPANHKDKLIQKIKKD
jgi:mannose-6-phosphate isomerase-like protein (cupin superfamily)